MRPKRVTETQQTLVSFVLRAAEVGDSKAGVGALGCRQTQAPSSSPLSIFSVSLSFLCVCRTATTPSELRRDLNQSGKKGKDPDEKPTVSVPGSLSHSSCHRNTTDRPQLLPSRPKQTRPLPTAEEPEKLIFFCGYSATTLSKTGILQGVTHKGTTHDIYHNFKMEKLIKGPVRSVRRERGRDACWASLHRRWERV